ncbi:MAG: peptidoglycan DD-metalloendopeptidase family protein [Anaerolineae bacterium]|nr:peptidoglycan DD-metalloendopeptidase family protein [Anaerolineae bacterium]
MQLNIPGYPGVTGTLEIKTLNLGESLFTISQRYKIAPEVLAQLNRITSPDSLYAGSELIVPIKTDSNEATSTPKDLIYPDMSTFEIGSMSGTNDWAVVLNNGLLNSWGMLPGDKFQAPAQANMQNLSKLADPIDSISITPLPLVQGTTVIIHVTASRPVTITGNLSGHQLNFFPEKENNFYALEGIHALAETGLKTIEINVSGLDNQVNHIKQGILLEAGSFIQEAVNGVDPNTIDPAVTKQEEDLLNNIANTSSTRLWSVPFRYPVDDPCLGSTFGNRRTYNDGTYNYYHTGVDFSVCANNLNIYAPAPGIVIYTGLLPTKGNYTIIDHGWGVYSCYAHQSEFKVKPGDKVDTGQVIGQIGNTGRTLGPHLHWEIWVNHIPVNPLAWVERTIP